MMAMAQIYNNPTERKPIRCIHVRIGEEYIKRSIEGQYSEQDARRMAIEMIDAIVPAKANPHAD